MTVVECVCGTLLPFFQCKNKHRKQALICNFYIKIFSCSIDKEDNFIYNTPILINADVV